MEEQKAKRRWAKSLIKVVVSLIALYVVYTKIDLSTTLKALGSANIGWLLTATLFFILSKLISAFRLLRFFDLIGISLGQLQNIRLYLIGMFYNLFLPGGIGGDAYKIYLLKQKFRVELRRLIGVIFIDRVSGLVALVFLALVLLLTSTFGPSIIKGDYHYLIFVILLVTYPLFYLFQRIMFRYLIQAFTYTNLLSVGVQLMQLVCAFFILRSLDVDQNIIIDYLTVFLFSSIVAVIPFTIGGIGARELVFVFAYSSFAIDRDIAVAFSLLFFIVTAIVSLSGVFIREDFDKKHVNVVKTLLF